MAFEPKFGVRPSAYDSRDIRFQDYVYLSKLLPSIPENFSHGDAVYYWGSLGNCKDPMDPTLPPNFDGAGNCVLASAGHETMVWSKESGKRVHIAGIDALEDYAALTGYDIATGANDEGTEPRAALDYRRHIGIRDSDGNRHRIEAYISLEPGNMEHLRAAMWLFHAVGFSFSAGQSVVDQFDRQRIWTYVPGQEMMAYHYVPLIAWGENDVIECVSWGRRQSMTKNFVERNGAEAWAMLSMDMLHAGRSPEGFDLAGLLETLRALRGTDCEVGAS